MKGSDLPITPIPQTSIAEVHLPLFLSMRKAAGYTFHKRGLPGGVDSLEPKFPTAIVDIIADLYFHLFKLRNVDYRAMTFGLCARQGTRLLYPASLRERRRRQPLLATVRLEATATCDNTCDLPSPAVRRRELREAGGRPVATPGV
jgi:hypothetical protein